MPDLHSNRNNFRDRDRACDVLLFHSVDTVKAERDGYVMLMCFAIENGNLASLKELDKWLKEHKVQFDFYGLDLGTPERAKINDAYKARKAILAAQTKKAA